MRATWVFFDLNGTLLDPSTIAEPLGAAPGMGAELLDLAVWQAMAGTMAGVYRPLSEYMRAAIEQRVELDGLERGAIDAALEKSSAMPAFPEAPRALDRLAAAGLRVGVLSNSPTGAAEHALHCAGLRERVELVTGSDEVEVFKPSQALYARGLERAGVQAQDVVMVAAHWWDVLGAARAGMSTGWVSRREGALLGPVPDPHFRGSDLDEVAEQMTGA